MEADTSIKWTRTPKKYLKWQFLLLPTCTKRTLVIKFNHRTCQTPEMRKIALNCHPQIFRFLHWKTWLDDFTWLVSKQSIVFYLVLFVWSLFHLSDFFKFELQSLKVSTVHLNGIWHLIWRYLLTPVLGGHPVLSGHNSIPWRCLLNTGFTVCWPLQIYFHQILSPGDYMGIILLFISFIRYYWLHSLLYKN